MLFILLQTRFATASLAKTGDRVYPSAHSLPSCIFAKFAVCLRTCRYCHILCCCLTRRRCDSSGNIHTGTFVIQGAEYFVERLHVSFGAGNNDIRVDATPAKEPAAHPPLGRLAIATAVGHFQPNGDIAIGVHAFGNRLHQEFGQVIFDLNNAVDAFVDRIDRPCAKAGFGGLFAGLVVAQGDDGRGNQIVATLHL